MDYKHHPLCTNSCIYTFEFARLFHATRISQMETNCNVTMASIQRCWDYDIDIRLQDYEAHNQTLWSLLEIVYQSISILTYESGIRTLVIIMLHPRTQVVCQACFFFQKMGDNFNSCIMHQNRYRDYIRKFDISVIISLIRVNVHMLTF